MKKLYYLLLLAIVFLSIRTSAQLNEGFVQKPNVAIPYGKKLPPPDYNRINDRYIQYRSRFGLNIPLTNPVPDHFDKNNLKERLAYLKKGY